jgi:hypothetical protein
MADDIESYWEVIRPSKRLREPREVPLSEVDPSPITMEDLPQPHPTVRPMIMNQDIYEDLLAWHSSTMNPHA